MRLNGRKEGRNKGLVLSGLALWFSPAYPKHVCNPEEPWEEERHSLEKAGKESPLGKGRAAGWADFPIP